MIVSNQIKCNKCGSEIFSVNRHDFKFCKCGTVAVDGGQAYFRRLGDLSDFTDMSIVMPKKTVKACEEAIKWGQRTGRNELGQVFAVIRALRDNGYDMNKNDSDDGK